MARENDLTCRAAAPVARAAGAGVRRERLLRDLEARAAPGADAGSLLQVVEARAALGDLARDVALADAVAEANNHGRDANAKRSY